MDGKFDIDLNLADWQLDKQIAKFNSVKLFFKQFPKCLGMRR